MFGEVGEAEEQAEEQGHRDDLHERFGEEDEIVPGGLEERGFGLDEVVEPPEQIHHQPEQRKGVEAVEERQQEFPQQVSVEDAHETRGVSGPVATGTQRG